MSARSKKEIQVSPGTFVLLDAHAIIHRAYHALPEFLSSSGRPTGALYGLSTMLMKIISELKPTFILACFDLPGKTFRHEAYAAYKAKRVKADPALVEQLVGAREIFEAFDIPIYDAPGFEADDVIGTIVAQLNPARGREGSPRPSAPNGIKIIIASGDMDTLQLVEGDTVQVYTLRKGISDTVLYNEGRVVERFGFVPKLLPDFKALRGDPSDNIVGIKGIGEKTASLLIAEAGSIEEIYKKLKDKSFEAKLRKLGLSPRIIKLIKENKEEATFSKVLAKIRSDAPIGFSIPSQTFWQGVDFKKIEKVFTALGFRSLLARLPNFFLENRGKKVGIKESTLKQADGHIDERKVREASIALWLINSDLTNPKLEDILQFAGARSFSEAYDCVFKELRQKDLEKVYIEIEEPLIDILEKMENRGILIDREKFKKLSREYHKELDILSAKIYRAAGVEFNLNSPKQLGEVLFKKLGLKGVRKSPGGALSTKVSVLEELAEGNPIIKDIMNYRELQKLLSTYIDVIPQMAGEDGRLRAKFLQTGTTTGRFSSQDPNLQNLPIKSLLGRRIREGFIAEEGYKLASFDYSQIELRAAAILSGDRKMTSIFREHRDIHAGVASFVFTVPIHEVTPEMRRQAKVINFGIIYGMGITALRKNLGGTREEAERFYSNYFKEFSGVRDYLEGVKAFAKKNGYTKTLFGRRRNFPNINSPAPFLKSLAERTAINAPIQGTAADIIKLAIRYAEEDLERAGLSGETRLLLVIHDELVYEVKENALSRSAEVIERAMASVLERSFISRKTDVPLHVHLESGSNLGEVK